MIIYDLKDSTKKCGGKAYGLSKLIEIGVPVPNGFVIYNVDINDIDEEKIIQKLQMFEESDILAIRSSASNEDGVYESYAGIFDTVLNVNNNIDDVLNSIKKVYNSKNSSVVKNYSNQSDIKMNIIIQKMIEPKMSGICFSKAIDIDGSDVSLIEYTDGLGDKLVSGQVDSNRVIVKYADNHLDTKNFRIEGNFQDFTAFDKLIKIIDKVIKNFVYDLDIEWCIDKNNNPYLVQARPITKNIFINSRKESNNTNTLIASRGCVEGETFVIDSDIGYDKVSKLIEKFPEGKILVTNYTETYYLPAMKKSIGIITNTGSSLCHAAIVAREMNIPCIVGCENATKNFPTGTKIKLDAINNSITSSEYKETVSNEFKLDFRDLDCFDNYMTIFIDDIKIFVECTFDGLVVHMPNTIKNETIEKIEIFIRKNFNKEPKYCNDDNKYLWIKEIERFRKLPGFTYYYNKIKESSKIFEGKILKSLQQELLDKVKKLVEIKSNSENEVHKFFIDEMIAYINELLDGVIPFGYPIYESYIQSLQLLEEEKKDFNDLFNNSKFKNKKLKKIQEYLKVVSDIKNETYQKIWDLGGIDPDYFEKRDDNIKNYLLKNKVDIKDEVMEVFYDKYLAKECKFLEEIMGRF